MSRVEERRARDATLVDVIFATVPLHRTRRYYPRYDRVTNRAVYHKNSPSSPLYAASAGRNLSDTPFMQYLSPVRSRGPSSKTCPRWPWQLAHRTSVRGRNTME
jgi:hypothetical protein